MTNITIIAPQNSMSRTSFLQSAEWMEFQKSLGRPVFEIGGDSPISANVVRHDGGLGKNYLYIPHGPEIDFNSLQGGIKNPARQFVAQLRELARQQESIFIKTEPMSGAVVELLMENGFKKSKKEIQASKTVVLDLDKSEEELLERMHHKTRYNIKVAEKHGITVTRIHPVKSGEAGARDEQFNRASIDAFWKLMRKTTERDKFNPHPKDYYKKLLEFFPDRSGDIKTDLILAFHEKKPVAGAIVLTHGETAYYLHGASDHNFRSMMAPYLLHWEIIKYLKEHSYKTYDLWGIDSTKWPGVTRFKLGWLGLRSLGEGGGGLVTYPGSFDLPIRKFWYFVYKTYRAIFK